jgi:hypothetical protein
VPDAYRQEFLAGAAGDTAVVEAGGTVKVPYESCNVLTTSRRPGEPGSYDRKGLCPGNRHRAEEALTGTPETACLVSVTGP